MKQYDAEVKPISDLILGMLQLDAPIFDLKNAINSTETSMSESGSITPTTLKNEFLKVDGPLPLSILQSSNAEQMKHIEKMLMDHKFNQQGAEKQGRLSEITKAISEIDNSRLTSDLEKVKTSYEIKSEKDKLNEEKRLLNIDLDHIVLNNRSLTDMLQQLQSLDAEAILKKNVIALKTYQENKRAPHTEVKRFALISENLREFVDVDVLLNPNILHPIEAVLFYSALLELKQLGEKSGGAICDIFVRGDNHIINKVNLGKKDVVIPEVHSVVLWKEGNDIIMLDPSKDRFSLSLLENVAKFANLYGFKGVTSGVEGVLYGHDNKQVGREANQSRDCIDIAVKIVLELTDQTNDPNKNIKAKMKDTFTQISTENKYTKHFLKDNNKQLRELRSTSSDIRHLALRIVQSLNLKNT